MISMIKRLQRMLCGFEPDSGSMAVEFALVAPVLIVLVMGTISFGIAFNMKLRLLTAAGAGVAYAQLNGASVTPSEFASFADSVTKTIYGAADFGSAPPKVIVSFNNTSDGSAADGYYCADGSPPVWRQMADASSDCGNNVKAGKFVTLTLSTQVDNILPTSPLVGNVIQLKETVTARVQ